VWDPPGIKGAVIQFGAIGEDIGMSWKELENAAPQLATFGLKRFEIGAAYLATLGQDGAPRVHPVTPGMIIYTLTGAGG
jgi:hypothetical protein